MKKGHRHYDKFIKEIWWWLVKSFTNLFLKGGTTKIKKNQIDDFLTALGVVVEG